jgi:hypothetical protein
MANKVIGLNRVLQRFKKFGIDGENAVKRELDISATNIQRDAFNAAPGPPYSIKQRITFKAENGGLTYKIGIFGTQDIDGYIEFGTGLNFLQIVSARPTEYTPEIRQLAYDLFYKTGDGTLRGQPYLFPAFFDESPKLIENLKSELTKLAKKV